MEKGKSLFYIGGKGLARHPDTQNLAGPFPHQIDTGVSHHAHNRDAEFAVLPLRIKRHESPSSAHLEQVVDHIPVPLASEDLGCSRLHAEVTLLVGPSTAEGHHGVESQGISRSTADFFSDEGVFADRLIPLDSRASPPAHHRQALFEASRTGCGERQAPDCKRGECDPQAVFFIAQAIFNRDTHIVERRYPVVDSPHPLEIQTSDGATWPLGFNDEGPISFLRLGILEFLRTIDDSRNDDQHGTEELAVLFGRIRNEKLFSRNAVGHGFSVFDDADRIGFYF